MLQNGTLSDVDHPSNTTHRLYPDGVVLHPCARCSKQYDTTVRWVIDEIVAYQAVIACDANPICPLLECIRPRRPNLVVLYSGIVALQATLEQV